MEGPNLGPCRAAGLARRVRPQMRIASGDRSGVVAIAGGWQRSRRRSRDACSWWPAPRHGCGCGACPRGPLSPDQRTLTLAPWPCHPSLVKGECGSPCRVPAAHRPGGEHRRVPVLPMGSYSVRWFHRIPARQAARRCTINQAPSPRVCQGQRLITVVCLPAWSRVWCVRPWLTQLGPHPARVRHLARAIPSRVKGGAQTAVSTPRHGGLERQRQGERPVVMLLTPGAVPGRRRPPKQLCSLRCR